MPKLIITAFLLTILSSVCALDIKFYYYSNENPNDPIEFTNVKISKNIPFDRSFRRVKVLCHGWEDTSDAYWIKPTVTKYLTTGEHNLITIDWGKYAAEIYPLAVERAEVIGNIIGKTLLEINTLYNVPLDDFHLIGHSLGAHVLGFAGQYINAHSDQRIGRITGLDPAGPAFNRMDPDKRLSVDDAYFVDAIHTHTMFPGYKTSIGHIDFWPNGGSIQAGCDAVSGCSHNRAPLYFQESINSTSFPAWYCDSIEMFNEGKCFDRKMIYMGDLTPRNIRGEFYLNTNEESPFGMVSY